MKTDFYKKLFGGILISVFCAAIEIHAQNRGGGGGGGGFGGFGGFGGGGFGGGTANRSGSSSTSGQPAS